MDALERLDRFLDDYNTARPHQGRWCYGKSPMQTFRDSLALVKEKQIDPANLVRAACVYHCDR
jgi:hypothetical protein